MMVHLHKFCCCCSLKCGAIFVGVVFFLLGILDTALSLAGWNKDTVRIYFTEISDVSDPFAFYVVLLLLGILQLFLGTSLLIGVFKTKQVLVLPMVLLIPVIVVVEWINLLLITQAWVDILCQAMASLIFGYFWVTSYQYWKEIKREKRSFDVV
jgi:hypothetical protein